MIKLRMNRFPVERDYRGSTRWFSRHGSPVNAALVSADAVHRISRAGHYMNGDPWAVSTCGVQRSLDKWREAYLEDVDCKRCRP